jgi:hypothetical protein
MAKRQKEKRGAGGADQDRRGDARAGVEGDARGDMICAEKNRDRNHDDDADPR